MYGGGRLAELRPDRAQAGDRPTTRGGRGGCIVYP